MLRLAAGAALLVDVTAACKTHVVVAAAHYQRDNASQALMQHILSLQREAREKWLGPFESLFLVVENDDDAYSRAPVEAAGLSYARNEAYPEFGFELGAWRWAVTRVLPGADVCDDAVVYLTQDSLIMNRAPMPHPPPASFVATRVYSFDGTKQLLGVPRSERHWQPEAAAAFSRVAGGPDAAISPKKTFAGCFGPNVVGLWSAWTRLASRGFFDMMRVRKKLDEQRSERVLGLFLQRDGDVLDNSSIGGDYLRAQHPSRSFVADLPFLKIHGYKTRSNERWHA